MSLGIFYTGYFIERIKMLHKSCMYGCVVFDYKYEQHSTVITSFEGGSVVVALVMNIVVPFVFTGPE
jgi:hypothetical protein